MGKRDMIFGGALFFICLLLINETRSFYAPPNQIAGPALWPRIILAILAILALILVYTGYLKSKTEAPAQSQEKESFFTASNKRVGAAMAVTFVFLFAFQYIGFIISILIYFLIITYVMEPVKGVKPFLVRLGQAIALAAFIYLVFAKGLSVRLPHGILPQSWF